MLNNARRVRDFVELGTIGKGGYGVVYKVLNPLDGGHYAIKQIPLTELDDLLREVRTMQQLDHPNIVRYHNAWLEQVNEPVPNTRLTSPRLILHIQMALYTLTLADYLSFSSTSTRYRHCFHQKISLQILLAILDGVQYLHAKGVAHRDLKPANIFLSPLEGDEYRYKSCVDLSTCGDCPDETKSRSQLGVKIGDFGLVTAIARPDETFIPANSKAVGTEFYRPPVTSGRENAKLDVFALGIILFELLWPFETRMERAETLKDLKLGKLPADFTTKMGACGDDIAACLMGMLCREETTRLSCSDVQRLLEAIVKKLEAEDST
ncbi:kinase-like protein [Saccharata proteae CBS 121410]|uniref:Kinase-like protein n=1 Tax=Saccharata proteae CBS 121410 TaxID=1314787 RepID=A0A6A5YAJ8_9PEZI|nr:kinase-like protein [Saccharata proteae CBS 121410]